MKTYKLPTGYLFTDQYSKGELETLSIGDYGKHKNVKADFLGYTEELNGVKNGETMPLQENGIETIDGYSSYLPYKEPEEALKAAGFDVLVFIPSQDEEDGIITCGNAILGGSELKIVVDNR